MLIITDECNDLIDQFLLHVYICIKIECKHSQITLALTSSPLSPAWERSFGFYANTMSAYEDESFDQDKLDGR